MRRFACCLLALGALWCRGGLLAAAGQEGLAARLQPLVDPWKDHVAVVVRPLDGDGEYCWRADEPLPTASLIKLPLMVAAYGCMARGELSPGQRVVLRDEDKVPGSGILTEHFQAGADLSLRDTIRLMIVWSDNTATNQVARLVGLPRVNGDMAALGLGETRMNSLVWRRDTSVDPERSQRFGLGSTTAREMVRLLELLERGQLHGPAACEEMKSHLLACDDRTKLARLLPGNVAVAHKSGEISSARCEAGIIYGGTGPILICVLTTGIEPGEDEGEHPGDLLMARIARAAWEYFNPEGAPAVAAGPLREGSSGPLVAALQATLNQRLDPADRLVVDGEFGPATAAAVRLFRTRCGLSGEMTVDAEFWRQLGPLVDPKSGSSGDEEQAEDRDAGDSAAGPPAVTAAAWALVDTDSGVVLAAHQGDARRQVASTTKMMTAWTILRLADRVEGLLGEQVQFSARAAGTEGSSCQLRVGEVASVGDMLYGLLLPSGNDAAVALAEHCGGRAGRLLAGMESGPADDPLAGFLAAMNAESARLGLSGSHWSNPNGLPDETNYSTAIDLGRLGAAVMRDRVLAQIVGSRRFRCLVSGPGGYQREVTWENTNRLLGRAGFNGIKTGTTQAAGCCLVASTRREGVGRIAVVLGAGTSESRYTDARNLLQWGWSLMPQDATSADKQATGQGEGGMTPADSPSGHTGPGLGSAATGANGVGRNGTRRDSLDPATAGAWAALALKGIDQEYPNKPGVVVTSDETVLPPRAMFPAFHGCFDWHSSVHGHWLLVRLLRLCPEMETAAAAREVLGRHLTAENLAREAEFFGRDEHKSFERMYGWAWLLRLVMELEQWSDPDGNVWRENLRPLEMLLVQRITAYLPLLIHPIRSGEHSDTGFALGQILDYARWMENRELEALAMARARDWYLGNRDYPVEYEPSGHDFFSSAWNEADLMRRVLTPAEFSGWLGGFLPRLTGQLGDGTIAPVEVSDVTDGKLVHLAGLNLSRAWCMRGVAGVLDSEDPRKAALEQSLDRHLKAGLAYVNSGHYEGDHWLATFALYARTCGDQ